MAFNLFQRLSCGLGNKFPNNQHIGYTEGGETFLEWPCRKPPAASLYFSVVVSLLLLRSLSFFYCSDRVQYLSISSSDFPVVSGTSFHTMSIYGTHMTANRKNVPAGVRFWSIQGVNCPIRYVPIHRANPAMDIASPRTLVGYISERSTNTTAQMETAQQNT